MAENILERIAADTRARIDREKSAEPMDALRQRVEELLSRGGEPPSFREALARDGLSFICEVKKASPSRGVMVEDFDPLAIAQSYASAGADALSVLTEPSYFQGSDRYLQSIVREVALPALRKDFTVDEYMLYQARLLGASAVLLIVAITPQAQLERYLALTHQLGMDAIVETHDAEELRRAAAAGARIIGINNRDLRSFQTSIETTIALRHLVPEGAVFVSESGIHTAEDIRRLKECGTDAVLIGEAMVTSGNKKDALRALREA